MKVEEEQANAFSFKHVDGPVAHISIVSIDTINNGDGQVIEYDAANNKIIAHNAGTATIYFTQEETSTIKSDTSATYTYTVTKRENKLDVTTSAYEMFVGDELNQIINGSHVAIQNRNNNDTAVSVTSDDPALLSYNPSTDKLSATNSAHEMFGASKDVVLTFSQPETYKYTGVSKTITVTVKKHTNTIRVNGSTAYSTSLNYASTLGISITRDNNNSVPVVSASSNSSVATYAGTGASGTITTYYTKNTAYWTVSQAEDYKYQAGSATMSVNVSPMAVGECVVLNASDQHSYGKYGDYYYKDFDLDNFDWTDCDNRLTFDIWKIDAATFGMHIYGYDKNNNQTEIAYYDNSDLSSSPSHKTLVISHNIVRIRVQNGGGDWWTCSSLDYYVKNIKVVRNCDPALSATPTSLSFGTILLGATTSKTFDVEWSSSNTGDIHIVSSDPTHFSVSQGSSPITNTACASGTRTVTITYHGVDANPHTGKITIYDKGRVIEVPVTGTTREKYNLIIEGSDKAMKVDQDLNAGFVFRYEGTNEKPSRPVDGDAPGFNPLADGNHFYYTISHDLTGNVTTAGSPDGTKVVSYDPVNDKLTALNAGTATITFHEIGSDEVNAHVDVSFNITVTKHDPTFNWTLPNAEWASTYKFSNYFSSSNTATSWSAVSNTPIAEYKSVTDSIYTNYRSGNATFTVTQVENYYWNLKEQTFTTNVQHGEETECYLSLTPQYAIDQEIKVWDFVQVTWQDTAVAGKVIFETKRGPWDVGKVVDLYVDEFVNGETNRVGTINDHNKNDGAYKRYEVDLNDYATGVSFDDRVPELLGEWVDYTNRVRNVKVTRVPWIKASNYDITLPSIGKQGHSQATMVVSWSGVEPLRIEQKTNNAHFTITPDEYFVQTPCTSGSSVLTITYSSDVAADNETETIVIYDHATTSREIVLHGTTEDKNMQEIVWNQSFNPILAENGTINADSILTAYAVDWQGVQTGLPIRYTVENTNIAEIDANTSNLLHIKGIGRTTITAIVDGNETYGSASKTLVLNVLDGNGCGSYALSRPSGVAIFTIGVDDAQPVTKPAEDLYFEAYKDWWVVANPNKQKLNVRYRVSGDNNWHTQDENGVEITTGALSSDANSYGPFRLPENTEGIQFYTEFGAYGNMHLQNVYITQRSYLRKDTEELTATIVVNNTTEIGDFNVEYSDKPTLIIKNKCGNVTLKVNNPAPNSCGDAGKYEYTVYCLSDTIGVIKDTVTITSHLEGDTLLIPITITVRPDGHYYFDNGIDNNLAHTDWQVPEYWRKDGIHSHGTLPTKSSLTTIEGPVVIDGDAYAYQVVISDNGKVTVAPTGSLTVGAGGIIGASVSNLVLEADNTGQTGALRLYPGIADEDLPDALVQIYTTAYWDRENKKKAVWQYIGTPVRNPDTNEHIFYQCWLYQYSPSADKWTNAGNWGHMTPFLAYAFTRDSKSSPLTGFGGQLNTLAVQKKDMTYYDKDHCEYHFANSWTAPINLKGFKPSDFHNVDPVIYCYTMEGKGLAKEIAAYSAEYTGEDVLPSMQGFFVRAKSNDEACYLTLDYERLVWSSESVTNKPLRAPSRDKDNELGLSARMCIQMTSADMVTDRIYLLEKDAEGFSSDYEIGYDAPKYFVDDLPCIYTYETSGTHLAVSATDNVVGTYLAINTNASQNYTLAFSKVIGEGLGLRDLVTNTIVPISEGMQYSFTAPANSSPMLRFVVVEHEETPEWNNNNGGTSLEDVGGEFKIWQSGEILSVIGAGSHANLRLYDAAGKLILSEFFNEATAISLTALPTGVYMVQVNDKTEKVLR